MNYSSFLHHLESLQEQKINPGLERMQEALELLGHPEKAFKSVHIAGTNGKGSTAAFLESILRNNSYKTGLYTSPHLIDVRERIQIGREMISEADLSHIGGEVIKKTAGIALSYFELLTLIAFEYFKEQKVDIAVFETGLGGRWDATNVVSPLCHIITQISMDHMKYLGDDKVSIAREKCGIIKDPTPTIALKGTEEVNRVIIERCAEVSSELTFATGDECEFVPALAGRHQRQNAALAVMAVRKLAESAGEQLSVIPAKAGIHHSSIILDPRLRGDDSIVIRPEYLNVEWSGRLQKISASPEIIVDGAHNIGGCRALVEYLKEEYRERKIVFIFAAMSDKEISGMIKILKEVSSSFVLFDLGMPRAVQSEELSKYFESGKIAFADSVPTAVEKALLLQPRNPLIVVAGSLYLTGRFLKELSVIPAKAGIQSRR